MALALAQPGPFGFVAPTANASPFARALIFLSGGLPFLEEAPPRTGPVLLPTVQETLHYGPKGSILLPSGVSSGYVDPEVGQATILTPDGSVTMCEASEIALGPFGGGLHMSPPRRTNSALVHLDEAAARVRIAESNRAPLTPAGMSSKSFTNLFVQGAPLGLGAYGDWCKAEGVALNLLGAGTFRRDPLGTQDPDSPMSFPMRMLTGDFFEKPLTTGARQELDMASARDSAHNTWTKVVRYALAMAMSTTAMHKIAEDTSKDEEARRLAILFHYNNVLANWRFGVEKLMALPCMAGIAIAQAAGPESPWWDFGYLLSALAVNIGLLYSNGAWFAKLKSDRYLLGGEQYDFAQAERAGKSFDLNGAHVMAATFDVANAIPRVAKHLVGHVSTLMLTAYLYAPHLFHVFDQSGYIQEAMARMNKGTAAENIYRWANFGFIVPGFQVVLGTLIASYAAFGSLRGARNKLQLDRAKRAELLSLDPDAAMIGSAGTHTVGERLVELGREVTADRVGVLGALCLVGVGLTVAYPAVEHIDLLFAAGYGVTNASQYFIRDWPALSGFIQRTIARGAAWAQSGARKAIGKMAGGDAFAAEEPAKPALVGQPPLYKRALARVRQSWRELRSAKVIVKEYEELAAAPFRDLPWHQQVAARVRRMRTQYAEWKAFLKAYHRRNKLPTPEVKAKPA